MVYALSYRRPKRIARATSFESLSGDSKQQSIHESIQSNRSGVSYGIPEALSFDRIIAGGVCPPCTVRDFMNFLKYIELSAENLQFFLWYRDYSKRFNELPETQKKLSPEWSREIMTSKKPGPPVVNSEVAASLKGTNFAYEGSLSEQEKDNGDAFFTPPRTASSTRSDSHKGGSSFETFQGSMVTGSKVNYTECAARAFQNAGLKWIPLTVQPYREEINRIISIYIADGGARQLNLSSRERVSLLHALQNTTHPSAFRKVMTTVEWTLRRQAHPNFIRWTICNGNRPRVVFARGLGIGGIVAGLVTAIVLKLSSAGGAWHLMSLIGFLIGISTLIAAWKGMCVVLHGMHHRHLRPWELFTSDDDDESASYGNSSDSFTSDASRNSWEDEPWVAKYEKRNIVRKIFDREVWIQEPALRQIQDTIFIQAILGAVVLSGIAVGILFAIPNGNYF